MSAKTIKDSTNKICSNITTQYIEHLKLVSAINESCEMNDTAQVLLFVTFMSYSGSKEEYLGLLPLKGQTHGEYTSIANAIIECVDKYSYFPQ